MNQLFIIAWTLVLPGFSSSDPHSNLLDQKEVVSARSLPEACLLLEGHPTAIVYRAISPEDSNGTELEFKKIDLVCMSRPTKHKKRSK